MSHTTHRNLKICNIFLVITTAKKVQKIRLNNFQISQKHSHDLTACSSHNTVDKNIIFAYSVTANVVLLQFIAADEQILV